VYKLAVKIYIE